jgi:DNA-binding MarR family transcriptional regulator
MLQVTGKLLRVADFATEGMWYASHRYRGLNTLESMTFQSLSSNSQDYLKVIWDLQEWTHEPIQPAAIAKRTGMKPSTVSGALGGLSAAGWCSMHLTVP